MGIRSVLLTLFAVSIAVLLHRDRASHPTTVHRQAQSIVLSKNISERPFYTTGPIDYSILPEVTLIDRISRKKIDNFVFNHYNQYKFQFTFIDLGYTSNFMFTFFNDQSISYQVEQKVGFDLHEKMLNGKLNLDLNKRRFNLTVRQFKNEQQTVTTFNLTLYRQFSSVSANFTHIIRNKQCFTAIRADDVVSHKCFGGLGSGKLKIDRVLFEDKIKVEGVDEKVQDKVIIDDRGKVQKSGVYHSELNVTRVLYDGLRGSGSHYRWVWGFMNGFSKIQFYALNHTIPKEHWIGINFGSVFGQGEDFAFIDGKIIPIEGLKYKYDQNANTDTNITFTSQNPPLEATFTVKQVHKKYEDLGVIKVDMVKSEGYWSGWIKREDGKKYEFYLIAGVIESFDSIF